MRRPTRSLVALVFVALSACSGGSNDSQASGRRQGDDTPTPTGLTADDPGCRYIVAGQNSRATNPGGPTEWMTAAVAEPFACYDKISFTFNIDEEAPPPPESPTTVTCNPAYTVEYREPPFGLYTEPPSEANPDGRGVSTSTAGFDEAKAVLYVEMAPAMAVSEYPRKPELAYPGNLRLTFQGMHHVVIVEWVQNLPEGQQSAATTTTTVAGVASTPSRVVWLIGLDEKRPFTVDCMNGPPSRINVLIMK
jgi:hypothetical protein